MQTKTFPDQVGHKLARSTDGLPPGPPTGRLQTTFRLHRDPLGFLRGVQSEFGDVFTLQLAHIGPVVVLADPASAAEVGRSDPETSRAGRARRGMLPMASTRSVFGADDSIHAQARARIESAFTPEAAARRAAAIGAVAERHLRAWPHGRPFRLLPRMRALADEIFATQVLGIEDGERSREVARQIGRLLWTPGNPPLTIPAPEQGILGRLVNAEYQRRLRPLRSLLAAELERLRRAPSTSVGVLGLVLAAEPDAGDRELIDELLALLMAAQEPMAAALTWIALRVGARPEIIQRLLWDTVDGPYGDAIIKEALRLNPPAMAMLRTLQCPQHLAGVELPADTTVLVPLALVHRDARLWREPDRFLPERHLEPQTHEPSPSTQDPWLVFGAGARSCLGQFLARAEIAIVIPALFERLRLRPLRRPSERMVLRATIQVPHRSGLVVATARNASPAARRGRRIARRGTAGR